MEANINPDLIQHAYPIEHLELLPGNANKGDVQAMAKTLATYSQMKPIVIRRLEEGSDRAVVIAGNTTLKAARDILGWSHVAVTWTDDSWDQSTALGFAVADNRMAELGETDNEALLEMLETIDDQELLESAGYYEDDLAALMESTFDEPMDIPPPMTPGVSDDGDEIEDDDDEEEVGQQPKTGNPVIQYSIIFTNEEQQQMWFSFVRWLKRQYPDEDTVADRLHEYLSTYVDMD